MSSLDEGTDGRATTPAARAARRALGVLSVVLALVLVGSGTAWAWWTDARSATTAASAIDLRPGTPTCTPKPGGGSDGSDSPATIEWTAPNVPAGSTVTYVVSATSASGTRTVTPSPATATSVQLYPANVGSSSTDKLRLQAVTVTATVTFPGGGPVWTSPPSDSVKAQAVRSFIFFFNMGCPA